MNRQRSLLVLIVVPAVVSLLVTLLVLFIWDRQQPAETAVILPTHSPTSMNPSAGAQTDSSSADGQGDDSSDNNPSDSSSDTDGTVGENGSVAPQPTIDGDCQNPFHVVESGEVLGNIAESYEVSVEDIIILNAILDKTFDADFLSVGQQLAIPVCGIPTPAPSPTPTHTPVATREPAPTPISTSTDAPPGTVQIVIAGVFNMGDITSEMLELVNEGTPVDLQDWILSNGRGEGYIFPSFRLFSGGRVAIHTGGGENTPIDLYWGLTESLWSVGDTISLFAPDGELHDEFEIVE